MSTKYYFTSNGSLREIRDDELMHIAISKGKPREDHKYISREWKNGKWVYTYKDDSKSGSKLPTVKNAAKNTTQTAPASTKKVSSEYEAEVAYNSQKNNYFGKNNATDKKSIVDMVNAGKSAVGNPAAKDTIKKTTQTAPASTKKVSSEYEAEVAYNSQKNQYPKSSKSDENTKKTDAKKSGWDKFVDNVKDWFGYDERDRLEEAEKAEVNAKRKLDDALNKQDDAFIEYFLEDDPAKKANAKEEYDRLLDESLKRGNEWSKTMEDTRNAQTEYKNTALKKTEDLRKFTDNLVDDVGDAVESVLNFPGAAAAVIGDKIEDTAFEVEYATSRALGVAQKKAYEAAKRNLREAQENLKNASGTTNTYLAEFYLEQAEAAYEDAKKAYSGTPLETIESGRDYVKNWFEDLFG